MGPTTHERYFRGKPHIVGELSLSMAEATGLERGVVSCDTEGKRGARRGLSRAGDGRGEKLSCVTGDGGFVRTVGDDR